MHEHRQRLALKSHSVMCSTAQSEPPTNRVSVRSDPTEWVPIDPEHHFTRRPVVHPPGSPVMPQNDMENRNQTYTKQLSSSSIISNTRTPCVTGPSRTQALSNQRVIAHNLSVDSKPLKDNDFSCQTSECFVPHDHHIWFIGRAQSISPHNLLGVRVRRFFGHIFAVLQRHSPKQGRVCSEQFLDELRRAPPPATTCAFRRF